MSEVEMKSTVQDHTYPPAEPPPYSGPPPSHGPGPSVVQSPTTVIHPSATTVIHGPVVGPPGVSTIVVTNQMSPSATVYMCPSCNQQIVTRVTHRASMKTHLFAILLCVFGCWPCVCIPYCMDSCNNADHHCPNCNSYIGSYIN